jgi:hypothetical protein
VSITNGQSREIDKVSITNEQQMIYDLVYKRVR